MGFAENLRDELEYQGMQVKELAEKTGLSINTLNKYRPGSKVVPTVDNAYKIARALDVSLDYLVTGTETKPAPRDADDFRRLAKKMRRFSKTDLRTVTAVIESIGEKYGM